MASTDSNTHDPYGTSPSGEDPSRLDAWSSPLWGDPHTVGGVWNDTPDSPAPTFAPPLPLRPPRRRSNRSRLLMGAAAMLAAVLVGVGVVRALPSGSDTSVALPSSSSASATPSPPPPPANPLPGVTEDPGLGQGVLPGTGQDQLPDQLPGQSAPSVSPTTLDPAAAAVAPGLVNITTTVGYDGAQAAGTGVALTSDGVILTNHHVIAGATAIRVAVAGTTKSYTADVLGYDATHDIGVIKLRDASGLTTAPLGDSSTVNEGDAVIGLGNAGGAGGSPIAAAGSVTGLGKSITALDAENGTSEQLTGLIETDADIQPGDSGGALVSSEGKVIGIVTAGSVAPSSSRSQATTTTDGYAIPINEALAIGQDIRDGKASSTVHIGASAFLGVSVTSTGRTTTAAGVTISGVVTGSAAAKAGLAAGDTITAIDGAKVASNTALRAAIAPHHPGDTVSVSWTDTTGRAQTHDVTFGQGPVA